MSKKQKVEIVVKNDSQLDIKLGEGSIWDAESGLLYWVDILGKKLHVRFAFNNYF